MNKEKEDELYEIDLDSNEETNTFGFKWCNNKTCGIEVSVNHPTGRCRACKRKDEVQE